MDPPVSVPTPAAAKLQVTATAVPPEEPAGVADPNNQVVSTLTNDINTDPTLAGVDQGNSTTNSGTDDWGDW